MSKVKCFPMSHFPEHCQSKALRQLFFVHHSIFGVRYSVFDILRFSSAPSDGGYRAKHAILQSAKVLPKNDASPNGQRCEAF